MLGKSNEQILNIYVKINLQIIKDSQTKCVKGWTIEIKSCVWHNLLKADFASHTIIVVLWDSWAFASQDKMIFSTKTKHTRSCSANYSMPFFLSLTQKRMHKNLTGIVFSEKFFFHEWGTMKLYVTSNWNTISEITAVYRLTDSKIK